MPARELHWEQATIVLKRCKVHEMMPDRNYFVRLLRTTLTYLLLAVVLSGCAAVHRPAQITYEDGAVAASLSSAVSLSYTNHDRSISGRGFLMYRKPDRMRVIILAPFGSVLQEIYVSGEHVTIVDAGNGIAFDGTRNELPAEGDFSGWRNIHWLIDIDAPDHARGSTTIERTNRLGQMETAIFENGLLISKKTAAGGYASYEKYSAIQGVPFPHEITCATTTGEKITIQFEDPDVNVSFAADAFTPQLGKLRVYPLSSLR